MIIMTHKLALSAISENFEKCEKYPGGTNQHQFLRSLCFLAIYQNFSLIAVRHNECSSRVDVEQYLIDAPKLSEFAKPFLVELPDTRLPISSPISLIIERFLYQTRTTMIPFTTCCADLVSSLIRKKNTLKQLFLQPKCKKCSMSKNMNPYSNVFT